MRTKIKKISTWGIDPDTHEPIWVHKEVEKKLLDEEDRIRVVLDILRGSTTPDEVREKYRIASIHSVYSWIGKYISQTESVPLSPETDEDMANKSKEDQIRELKAELKRSRKEADLEKLRAHAYDKMIDIAEETFNIPIRKKSGTKQ